MAKSKTRANKPAKSSRPAAEKSGSPKAPTEGPGQSEKLIQIQANKIILEALREVSVLLRDKMMDADRDIAALKKEREANKTFVSYQIGFKFRPTRLFWKRFGKSAFCCGTR